ncbi:MAG: PQQ-dependent sugar dehydrogenase [Acidimicrobiia bacterium]|nr:PQQ-dependent sugar dehydrogenase [Acidimicrobiia bacterium]
MSRRLLPTLFLALAACAPTAVPEQTTTVTPAPTTSSVPATTTSTVATTTTTVPTTTTTTLPPFEGLAAELITDALRQPVFVAAPPGDSSLYVLERGGRIRVLAPDGTINTLMDLTGRVGSGGIEQGLLGLAFHPAYAENGRVFAYYTNRNTDSELIEFQVPPGSDMGDPASIRVVLNVTQPTIRHNAGMVEFGPDGYLYVSLGEGGAAGVNAQNPKTLLSAILRLDVDGEFPYEIPPDNPFADGVDGAPEVWAYGLRNPWRFSIDPVARLIYIGDVGHERWEEVDVVPIDGGGYNFGWLRMEGSQCFSPRDCDPTGMILPALEYGHEDGCSITGGYVYRGTLIPELVGHYFYSDWCTGFLRSFRYIDGATEEADWSDQIGDVGMVTSFGLDGASELLFTTWDGGLYRIVAVREAAG